MRGQAPFLTRKIPKVELFNRKLTIGNRQLNAADIGLGEDSKGRFNGLFKRLLKPGNY